MTASENLLLTLIVRMVVPLRREFGMALDVHQFVHDSEYAGAVLDKARASADAKLRELAAHVEQHSLGPRAATAPGSRGAGATPAPSAAPSPAAAQRREAEASEEELRARMMKKYTTGLR